MAGFSLPSSGRRVTRRVDIYISPTSRWLPHPSPALPLVPKEDQPIARDIPICDDFPDGFHEQLARVVIEFGRIEYLIKLCLKDIKEKGFDDGMAVAESVDKFHRLCENTRTAGASKLTEDEFDALNEFLAEAMDLAAYRNDSVHACWTTVHDEIIRVRPYWDGTRLCWDGSRSVTMQELTDKADDMQRLHHDYDPVRMGWSVRVVE